MYEISIYGLSQMDKVQDKYVSGFPQKFKNTIPSFFHDQQCNIHDYLMHAQGSS